MKARRAAVVAVGLGLAAAVPGALATVTDMEQEAAYQGAVRRAKGAETTQNWCDAAAAWKDAWNSFQRARTTDEHTSELATSIQGRLAVAKQKCDASRPPPPPRPTPGPKPKARPTFDETVTVPAGTFTYGCVKGDTQCFDDETPAETVHVDEFNIDKYEVTTRRYLAFVASRPEVKGNHRTFGEDSDCNAGAPGREDHPMNCVSWKGADAFCRALKRVLPGEKAWEKAARGKDGRLWPWGNEPPDANRAVMEGSGGTRQVGSKPDGESPYGALDMAGNVREWTADRYDNTNDGMTVRGGSWDVDVRVLRASYRDYVFPANRYDYVGFRCTSARGP